MPENLTPNARDNYLPSSSEKKQAVLMYMFVGLLLSMGQQDVSPYMHHHIKQSMGWIVLLVATIFLDVILVILGMVFGFFSRLALLITLPVLIIGIMCIKQARDGKYVRDSAGSLKFFGFFAGLGTRVLNLFDADHYQSQLSPSTGVATSDSVATVPENGLANEQQIPTITPNSEASPQTANPSEIDLSQYEINATVAQPTPPQSTPPEQ